MTSLVWFRSDLRTIDNPALHRACQSDDVHAAYILCDEFVQSHPVGARQLWLIRESLKELRDALAGAGIGLSIARARRARDIPDALAKICQTTGAERVWLNAEYPLNELNRDLACRDKLAQAGIDIERYHDRCIVPPGMLKTGQGETYKVFTPFSRQWRALVDKTPLEAYPAPEPRDRAPQTVSDADLDELFAHWQPEDSGHWWETGQFGALKRLDNFVHSGLTAYDERRDFPAEPATSCLSPYLAIGAVSPKQCFIAATQAVEGHWRDNSGAFTWINELIWREFYSHIIAAFPALSRHRAMQGYTENFPWRRDEHLFQRWCEGRTGVPIVDAAMRQLNQTGWMHNRLRMITAMFLSKNLRLDWRWGERYFGERLIDYDFASNNGGWQWSASTGTDAAPYFRIMNPNTQSERFDPQGHFIRRYVPELAHLTAKAIHNPGPVGDYPAPIVDVKASRAEAIELFKRTKEVS